MEKQYKRGIHDEFLLNSLKQEEGNEGKLYSLLELVRQSKDLVLQIRDNYFNIYYLGGNVAEVESPNRVKFDKNYFRKCENKTDEDWDAIKSKSETAKKLFKEGKFAEYLDFVTTNMKFYWDNVLMGKGLEEKKAQHAICLSNTDKDEYTILDLEYQVSKKSQFHYNGRRIKDKFIPTPRFDIIAIRNCDHRLCVIELKKGVKALNDPSGVQEHAESFANTIGYNKESKIAFIDEMNNVLMQKRDDLGLIDKRICIETSLEPVFMFAYQFDSTDKSHPTLDSQKRVFKYYQNKMYVDGVNYAYDKRVLWLNEGDYTLKGKGEL